MVVESCDEGYEYCCGWGEGILAHDDLRESGASIREKQKSAESRQELKM